MGKTYLPTKICPVCQKPFTWRKKWQNIWDTGAPKVATGFIVAIIAGIKRISDFAG